MATNKALAATSAAIQLLFQNAAQAPSATDWANAQVEVYQADDLQHPISGPVPKLSVYLYRVALSSVRRDRGPRVVAGGTTFLPSIPLDLHYLVTAWSAQADTAQLLMGWAISILNDTPVIPTSLLNTYQPGRAVFGTDESVELVWDPVSLTDLYDVWQVSTTHQAPSASYVARSVVIDSDVELEVGPLVQQRQFAYSNDPA